MKDPLSVTVGMLLLRCDTLLTCSPLAKALAYLWAEICTRIMARLERRGALFMHVYVQSASLPPTCLPVRDLVNPKRSSPCMVTAAAHFSDDRSGYSTSLSCLLRHRHTHHAIQSSQRAAEEENKERGTGRLPPSTPPQSTPQMPYTKFLSFSSQKAFQIWSTSLGLCPRMREPRLQTRRRMGRLLNMMGIGRGPSGSPGNLHPFYRYSLCLAF